MKLVILISKGLIRDMRSRRFVMTVSILAAAAMVFVGMVLLGPTLLASPVAFIAYWCLCGILTVFSVLLAIYDMLALRLIARRAKRKLRSTILENPEDPPEE